MWTLRLVDATTERAVGIRVSDRRATPRRSRRSSPSVQTPIQTHALTAVQVHPSQVARLLTRLTQRYGVCLPRAIKISSATGVHALARVATQTLNDMALGAAVPYALTEDGTGQGVALAPT